MRIRKLMFHSSFITSALAGCEHPRYLRLMQRSRGLNSPLTFDESGDAQFFLCVMLQIERCLEITIDGLTAFRTMECPFRKLQIFLDMPASGACLGTRIIAVSDDDGDSQSFCLVLHFASKFIESLVLHSLFRIMPCTFKSSMQMKLGFCSTSADVACCA